MSLTGGLWSGLTRGLAGVAAAPSGPTGGDGSTCPLATLIACDVDVPFTVSDNGSIWFVAARPGPNLLVSASYVLEQGTVTPLRYQGADCDHLTGQSWLTQYHWDDGNYIFVKLTEASGDTTTGTVKVVTESSDPPGPVSADTTALSADDTTVTADAG